MGCTGSKTKPADTRKDGLETSGDLARKEMQAPADKVQTCSPLPRAARLVYPPMRTHLERSSACQRARQWPPMGCDGDAALIQLRCAEPAAVELPPRRPAPRCPVSARAQGALAVADGKADGVPLTNGKKAHAAASAAAPAASTGPNARPPAAPKAATPAPTAATAAVATAGAPAPMPAYKVMPADPAPDTGAAGAAPSPFAAAPPLAEEEDDREPLQRSKPQKAKREYQGAPLPANEPERHAQLCKLGVLDSEPDPRFDDITKLVRGRASLCQACERGAEARI